MFRYIKRYERIERAFITHACVRRSVGLELSNFSQQLKIKTGTDKNPQMIVELSNVLRLGRMEFDDEAK